MPYLLAGLFKKGRIIFSNYALLKKGRIIFPNQTYFAILSADFQNFPDELSQIYKNKNSKIHYIKDNKFELKR